MSLSEAAKAAIRRRLADVAAQKADPVANEPQALANAIAPVANAKRGRYRDADKRRAYMRDLMRARRAAGKA